MKKRKNKVLIIAGLDPLGYSGLIRDTQMIHQLGLEASGVVTALTAQTKNKFFATQTVGKKQFQAQLSATLPLHQYQAIKLGMLGNEDIVNTLVSIFKKYKINFLVCDPVIQSSSGGVLLTPRGQQLMLKKLVPLCHLWTPNIPEASTLLQKKITTREHMMEAVHELFILTNTPLLLKGGHLKGKVIGDIFYDGKNLKGFFHKRSSKKLRGTGCTLASLIAGHKKPKHTLLQAITLAERNLQKLFNES